MLNSSVLQSFLPVLITDAKYAADLTLISASSEFAEFASENSRTRVRYPESRRQAGNFTSITKEETENADH